METALGPHNGCGLPSAGRPALRAVQPEADTDGRLSEHARFADPPYCPSHLFRPPDFFMMFIWVCTGGGRVGAAVLGLDQQNLCNCKYCNADGINRSCSLNPISLIPDCFISFPSTSHGYSLSAVSSRRRGQCVGAGIRARCRGSHFLPRRSPSRKLPWR